MMIENANLFTDNGILLPEAQQLAARLARPRRSFLAKALGLGAGAVGLAAVGGGEAFGQGPGVNDAAILQFALNLEYLESEFYTYAADGVGIAAKGIGTTGTGAAGPTIVKQNSKVPFQTPLFQQFANELAIEERIHVTTLRTVLQTMGVTPVAKPKIDLQASFATAAQAAGLGPGFDPFANEVNFLLGTYIFEDVGVTAYHGAAPLIRNKTVLSAAAGILAIEAYHSGAVRGFLYQQNQGSATDKISALRRALSGKQDDFGIDVGPLNMGPAGNASLAVADANGIAFSRTTRQVLNIVYGAQNSAGGLFFPNGMNGPIR